jgi:glycosyltransferase involved in cell wall biosynthesis
MKKRRIVLASVLKPVNDTRMFEKIGGSLARVDGYQVFIIGFPSSKTISSTSDITFLPLKAFSRLSINRLIAPLAVLKKTIQVKPELLIVNTHELLIVGLLNRILFGTRIIYDIRENYALNIRHTNAFPQVVKALIAGWVRIKEVLTSPFFHGYFLAEKIYAEQLSFVGKKGIVLENKAITPTNFRRIPEPGKIRLLFSGTLAESTGVFQAIELAKELNQLDKSVELKIIGSCAQPSTQNKLLSTIQNLPFVTLIGGDKLVPHPDILDAIHQQADFGIICYPVSEHIHQKIPTKLYEYLAYRLPVLLQENPLWEALCNPYPAAIPIDFANPVPETLLVTMKTTNFYRSMPDNVTWDYEESRLLQMVDKFFI